MNRKSLTSTAKISGINIYKDKTGRAIYYDRLEKRGYLLQPKDTNLYVLYSKRFLIPIFVFFLLYDLQFGGHYFGFQETLMIAVITIMMMEVMFRFHYLRSLQAVPGFQPTGDDGIVTRMTKDTSKGMLIYKAVLYFALGALLILLAYTENFGQVELICCYILSFIVSIVAVIYLIGSFRH